MCTLFGALSTTMNSADVDTVRELSYLACFRGIDSTGIAMISREKNKVSASINKSLYAPPHMFKTDLFKEEQAKHEKTLKAIS